MKKFSSITQFIENTNTGTFGVSIISVTEPQMNKKNNPYFGRLKKATYMTNVALGYNYENVINARLERKGIDSYFKSEAPKGRVWEKENLILKSIKDENQKYLRTTMRNNTIAKVIYVLDGNAVNDNVVLEDIKNYIKSAPISLKQKESGLEENEQVIIRDFKFESIISIKQGDKEYKIESSVLDLF